MRSFSIKRSLQPYSFVIKQSCYGQIFGVWVLKQCLIVIYEIFHENSLIHKLVRNKNLRVFVDFCEIILKKMLEPGFESLYKFM